MYNAITTRIEVEMNKNWMKANPDLAVKDLIEFVAEHQEKYTIAIVQYPTNHYITLVAKIKE